MTQEHFNNYPLPATKILRDGLVNGMTICIAARGVNYEGGPGVDPVATHSIIAICDRMISYGDAITVDDALFKRFKIHPRWRAMFSGNDLGPLTPMMRFVEDRLSTREGDLEEVADAFRNAFHNHLHLLAVDTVLGKFGHTQEPAFIS